MGRTAASGIRLRSFSATAVLAITLGAFHFVSCARGSLVPHPDDRPYTPRWAFEPWISKDISDRADTETFVRGFQDRDIPVGVLVIDSPWETNYNTFVPNPSRYPDFGGMVSDLRASGVRVVLWITQMINDQSFDFEEGGDIYTVPSPNYRAARDRGYFVNNGALYSWWKGRGGALDFFNPTAVAWWHRQQDPILGLGVSGWKLDFGDSYVTTPVVETSAGPVPHQEYSEAYYRDFYRYGIATRGKEEFVTMVRAWDESYNFPGRFFARPEHAPVAWAGDNRRDWVGLSDALDRIFRSAVAGYVAVGSDIGGYLDRDDKDLTGPEIPFDQEVFVRWAALGALTPFMQLHGRANIAPWTVPARPEETVSIYRYWATLHSELVPFFYSLAEEAYAGGPGILRPLGEPGSWPGDYRFMLGEAFLVAPLLDGTGRRDIELPSGSRWYDWWDPGADPVEGGQVVSGYDATDRSRIPLFIREGAIVPLNVRNAVTGLGITASTGKLTVLVYPEVGGARFRLHEEDNRVTEIEAGTDLSGTTIVISRCRRPTVLRVWSGTPPQSVREGGTPLQKFQGIDSLEEMADAGAGWLYDPLTRSAWIALPAGTGPRTVTLS